MEPPFIIALMDGGSFGAEETAGGDASADPQPDAFEELVLDAIDALPEQLQRLLADLPVVVSDLGLQNNAYGEYFGEHIMRPGFENRIAIYRDTLERDFGHDRELLARQIEQTLRHELAHHLGFNEGGVTELGL